MRNPWIRFGCFLTGYNYRIVAHSSEAAVKSVKRYASAMVIVCIVWAFVGYTFTQRYLQGTVWASVAGAVISVVIIVQIERQIILSLSPNKGLYFFRSGLALMMALIGACIIDQTILKQDIELEKIGYIQKRVDSLLPMRSLELRRQILSLDTNIQKKDAEMQRLRMDIAKHPVIKSVSVQTRDVQIKSSMNDSLPGLQRNPPQQHERNVIISNIPNPNISLLPALDSAVTDMRRQKNAKEAMLLNVQPALKKEIEEKTGFLDDLKIMVSLVSNSAIALAFWILWMIFLLSIEMLVLFGKMGDKQNDYDKTVLHQMNLQMKKLDVLAQKAV